MDSFAIGCKPPKKILSLVNRIIGILMGLLYNSLKLYIVLAILGRIRINIDIGKHESSWERRLRVQLDNDLV